MNKLKNIVFLVLVLLIAGGLWGQSASAGSKPTTFGWEQAAADMPNMDHWNMFYAFAAGGPYTLLATIPYDGAVKPEYTSLQPLSIVPDGQKKTAYFVVTAVGKNGFESGKSNEVNLVLDFTTVSIPVLFHAIMQGQ